MLTLAWGLFLLVLLAGAGAVLAALLDCDAALLPLPLLSAAALVLYPFGMLGNLRIGAAAAVLLLGAAVVVSVVRLRPAGRQHRQRRGTAFVCAEKSAALYRGFVGYTL